MYVDQPFDWEVSIRQGKLHFTQPATEANVVNNSGHYFGNYQKGYIRHTLGEYTTFNFGIFPTKGSLVWFGRHFPTQGNPDNVLSTAQSDVNNNIRWEIYPTDNKIDMKVNGTNIFDSSLFYNYTWSVLWSSWDWDLGVANGGIVNSEGDAVENDTSVTVPSTSWTDFALGRLNYASRYYEGDTYFLRYYSDRITQDQAINIYNSNYRNLCY